MRTSKEESAGVILYDELPIAGPYPAPGITRQSAELFRQRLLDLKVDAVIAGNGGCGICTPKETGSCIVAEKLGIPAVIVTAPGFDNQARYTARNNGVPVLRVAVYPGAYNNNGDSRIYNMGGRRMGNRPSRNVYIRYGQKWLRGQ